MNVHCAGRLDATCLDTRFGPQLDGAATEFRLWAPSLEAVEVVFPDLPPLPLERSDDGFWSAHAGNRGPGTRYKFRAGDRTFPDPASRQQDGGTAGWSIVCAPLPPQDLTQPLRPWHETILCEVHVGTATPEGTFAGLAGRLEHFRDAGYTALELMPINAFSGSRNWGYDGTLLFAPADAYGSREDLRMLVDRAHELGLCLVLDVVYNHFGEVDNFIGHYAPEWFNDEVETPWGQGIDFTRPMVRQFYYENAAMWLGEYGFDGLRLDAIHEMKTEAGDKFLSELAAAARMVKPDAKLIVENRDNLASWLERDDHDEPKHFTAQWNDDIQHALLHLTTGQRKPGHEGKPRDPIADLEKGLADGFIHDGETNGDGETRGEPSSHLPPDAFVSYAQNHDQIGNRADALRLASRIGAEKLDFLRFVVMLAPQIPLFFIGEEGQLETPFPFFIDLPEEAGNIKARGRYRQMREDFGQPVEDGALPDPNDQATFLDAKLDWSDFEKPGHRAALERFRELAGWRRDNIWPLSATLCRDAHTVRQGSAIVVNWEFEAGYLTMALNASDLPMDIACVITGAPMTTGEFSQQGEILRLGAWSAVAWTNPKSQGE